MTTPGTESAEKTTALRTAIGCAKSGEASDWPKVASVLVEALASRDETIAGLTKRVAEFEAVSFQMVPGEHGQGEEVPCTPESLRSGLTELQEEWDNAEKRLTTVTAERDSLEQSLSELQTSYVDQGSELSSHAATIEGLKRELQESKDFADAIEQEKATFSTRVAELERERNERQRRIEALSADAINAQSELAQARREAADFRNAIRVEATGSLSVSYEYDATPTAEERLRKIAALATQTPTP